MSQSAGAAVWNHLRRTLSAEPFANVSDGDLLHRFTTAQDESAFTALMHRHGQLVWSVCRHVLRHEQDAEDAFQAVFLVLHRKAGSIRHSESLGSWLYGVAFRVASHARRVAARSRQREQLVEPPRASVSEVGLRELQAILAEEVSRLPAKYRAPFVLCCLEGRTRDEAARELRCHIGTLSNRLALARERLRARLARRGVALAAALATADLSRDTRAVPGQLLTPPTDSGWHTVASARAVAWADAVGQGHVVKAALALVCLGLLAGGLAAAGLAGPPPTPDPPAKPVPEKELAAEPVAVDAQGDPLPEGALRRFGSLRYRHHGVNNAALSPDGKTLAGTSEAALIVFDLETGRQLHVVPDSGIPNGFEALTSTLAFAPDGKTVASVSAGSFARVWDVKTGKEVRRLGWDELQDMAQPVLVRGNIPPPPHRSAIHFGGAGQELLLSYKKVNQYHARFQDAQSGKLLRQLAVAGIVCQVTPDGKELLIVDEKGGRAALASSADGAERQVFRVEGDLHAATLGVDGRTVAAANRASEVWLWDAATGKERARWDVSFEGKAGTEELTVLAVTANGKVILAGTTSGAIRRWDVEAGKELSPLQGHLSYVTGLFLAPDANTLVSVGWDGVIRRWDLTSGKEKSPGPGYNNYLRVAVSPDGRLVAAGDGHGRLELWEMATGKLQHTLQSAGPQVSVIVFRPGSSEMAVAQDDVRVVIWDVARQRQVRSLSPAAQQKPGGQAYFTSLVYSPDGRLLLSSAREHGTWLWDAATGKERWHQPGEGKAAFSPDGRRLIIGGWKDNYRLFFRDPATGEEKAAPLPVHDRVDAIAFAPDGQLLATSHYDGTIRLRDPDTGQKRKQLTGHTGVVWDIAFSPDGKWLFSAGNDNVRLWEVATGQEVWARGGHVGRVWQAHFSPDGKTALSACWDLTALLWTLRPAGTPAVKGNADKLWDDLAAPEAPKAYRAIWALADDPRLAAKLLQAKLPTVKVDVSKERVAALIDELDSLTFSTRQAAAKALTELAGAAAGPLRAALPKAKSPEQRQRIEDLLARLKREPTPEDLRVMRAVSVLELGATPETQEALRRWAEGTEGVLLTEQARAALGRLTARAKTSAP